MAEPFKLIDLFAGCGGFTLGFTQLRTSSDDQVFEPVWANDFDADAVRSYNANFGDHCVHADIVDLLEEGDVDIPSADVVIGGPPCQGYSLLNKQREADPRRQMWRPFMKVVQKSGADVFVMENVPQLLGSQEHRDIQAAAKDLGFRVTSSELLAADYGVPQTRRRAFILGSRVSNPADHFPPPRSHYDPNDTQTTIDDRDDKGDLEPWRDVEWAIGDLPPPIGTEILDVPGPMNLHFSRSPQTKSIRRYMAIPGEGENRFTLEERVPEITPKCWKRKKSGGTDIFGRLWWDRPAFTMRTEFFKPEKGRFLHPEQHRAITHREAARFQSFPDWFEFKGSKIEIARQIGNAVPPLLAEKVARSALKALDEGKCFANVTSVLYVKKSTIEYELSGDGMSEQAELKFERVEDLVQRLKKRVNQLQAEVDEDDLRSTIQSLLNATEIIGDIGEKLVPGSSGRERMLNYLLRFPRERISGAELQVVSGGLKQYARRLRELRVEHGWPIYSGNTIRDMIYSGDLFEPDFPPEAKEMRPDDYMLLETERDEKAAERWNTANKIRNSGGSISDRVLSYLREYVGEPVTGEELRYVADDAQSWPRRVRELRTEEGWPVKTANTGRPDLGQGEYILEEDKQDEPHDRQIPDTIRTKVFDRDRHKCRKCGWSYADRDRNPDDPRTKLETHHIQHHAEGGTNNTENLVTLCNVCHDEVHRSDRLQELEALIDWLDV